jgi:hypothetical protein
VVVDIYIYGIVLPTLMGFVTWNDDAINMKSSKLLELKVQ